MIKIEGYQCEHCGELFEIQDDCEEHEDHHITEEDFNVTELIHSKSEDTSCHNFDNGCGQFPDKVIAENKIWSGYAAMYRLEKVGAVEEIYPFDENDNL